MTRFNRVLAVASIAAVTLTGCGGDADENEAQPQTQQVQTQEQVYDEYTPTCVDPNTQEVLPLDYCEGDDDDSGDFLMTYVLMSALMNNGNTTHVYPQVGQTIPKSSYVTTKPKTGTQVSQSTFAERTKTYAAKKSSPAPVQQKKQVTKADQAPKKSEVKAPVKKKSVFGSSSSSKSGGFKSSTRRK